VKSVAANVTLNQTKFPELFLMTHLFPGVGGNTQAHVDAIC
jgi:hypothetical protein